MFRLWHNQGITWLDTTVFKTSDLVLHAFSTKLGGVSPFPYRGLNMGFYTNDIEANVIENRKRFIRRFNLKAEQVASLKQVHSDKIVKIGKHFMGNDFLTKGNCFYEGDALITGEKKIALYVGYADCVPILFLDPKREVIAAVHAGWRGTVSNIGKKTVEKMVLQYGSEPKDILAAIGPSIGPQSFEVGEEVIKKIKERSCAYTELLLPTRKGHAYLDLWRANEWQLLSAGLKKENIDIARFCTYKRSDLFFSHRKSLLGNTGRMGAFIMLK